MNEGCTCKDCGNKYRLDLNVPNYIWEEIKPANNGLLCGSCIMKRMETVFNLGAINRPFKFTAVKIKPIR